ncbi:MAG TPA: LamG-like jellyroll fold domain-containing protein [Thermoguttaceae bacterium]|nr:LamG-like jellyroll fold domain-containing protein [Thermoguttaceae bacterium]
MRSCPCKGAFTWAAMAACLLLASSAGAQSVFDDAVAYWAFEETGDTIVDSKGVANMAIADATSPVRITGLVGGGLQINPVDQQYATTGVDVDALDFNRETLDSFSVAGWVKQYDGSPVFIKMEDSGNYRGWHLQTGDGGTIDFLLRSTNLNTDKISVTGKGRIPLGEWVHLAATFSYDVNDAMLGVKIYVNGDRFDTTLAYGGLADDGFALLDTTNDKPFQFTAREAREYLHYDASFDEVGVWDRVLSPTEVQQLVNAGVPDVPVTNYIENGNFENTTGWVPAGADVLPPEGWAAYINKNNPTSQATGTGAIGGTGTSALMEAAALGGFNQRGMSQSFVHQTDSQWKLDLDFATEAPNDPTRRTFAMTLRTDNGAQVALIVSDPDNDGLGDLMVGGAAGYEVIPGLEDFITFDSDLSDLTGSVHHLKITGHFDAETPNYDITLTDTSGVDHTVTGITTCSGDMGTLVTGAGLGQMGFYTFASYGDWVIDNVSLVDYLAVQIPGDATGEGQVNAADAEMLAANWGTTTGATWSMGDFNGDGAVNALDASILAANWGAGGNESAATVPEPGSAVLLALFALAALPRRTRRRS